MARDHPVGVVAGEKSNGGYAGGDHAAFALGRIFERGWMRREASPADCAGQAELIEPLGIVVGDAAAQDFWLPGVGRDFEALQLVEDFAQGALTGALCIVSYVLPPQEPAEALCGCRGVDLM